MRAMMSDARRKEGFMAGDSEVMTGWNVHLSILRKKQNF